MLFIVYTSALGPKQIIDNQITLTMKITNLIASLVLICLTICGCSDIFSSTLIEPQFQVGEQAIYQSQSVSIATDNGVEVSRKTGKHKMLLSVKGMNSEGYVLRFKPFYSNNEPKHSVNSDQDLIRGVVVDFTKQLEYLFQTDKNGQLIDVANFVEINELVDNAISAVKADHPQGGKGLEAALNIAFQSFTNKEIILIIYREVGGLLGLYGKKFKEGDTLVSNTITGTVTTQITSVTPPSENSGYIVKTVSDTQSNEDYYYEMSIKHLAKAGDLTDDDKAFMRRRANEIAKGLCIHSEVTYEFFSNGWVKSIKAVHTPKDEVSNNLSTTKLTDIIECIDSKKLKL